MILYTTKVLNNKGLLVCNVPGHFETLAVSKRTSYLPGRFETFLGFETAWPVQNLVSKWPNQ